jgi:hypothetical protein
MGTPDTAASTYHAEGSGVYHTRDDCPIGRVLAEHTRQPGTGGFPLCEACAQLDLHEGEPLERRDPSFGQ